MLDLVLINEMGRLVSLQGAYNSASNMYLCLIFMDKPIQEAVPKQPKTLLTAHCNTCPKFFFKFDGYCQHRSSQFK